MMASANEIDEFVNGALVTWLESCLPDPTMISGYSALLDGILLHNVWLQIDPEPQHNPIYIKDRIGNALCIARMKNFECIVQNLIALFDEEFGQIILVLPDTITLGYQPETKHGLEQMKLLLTLLLGAAVQCPNKELFIARIKELDVDTQHSIMEYIKQVTDNNSLVLQKDSFEMLSAHAVYNHLIRLTKERDMKHNKLIASVSAEPDIGLTGCAVDSGGNNSGGAPALSPACSNMNMSNPSVISSSNLETNHMAVELADLKSRIRKLRQELEEKAESQIELREELEYKNAQFEKLRLESQEWYAESKRAVAYRDEVDVLRERADRADRLEIEVQKLRDKVADAEFYKTRVEEIKEDNRLLLETKEMLEEQLQRLRKRTEHAKALESELNHFKQKYNDIISEQHANAAKIDELLEQNTQLQLIAKNLNTSHDLSRSSDNEDDCNSGDNSLSEQLTNSAQSRAFKLELENKRLLAALDHLKESSLNELTNQINDLEDEKKKLTIKSEQTEENLKRLTERNTELENLLKDTVEVNQKLQDALDNRQKLYDRQSQERELERNKLIDLEKHIESLKMDKQSIQILNTSMQRRADDLERLVETKTKEIEELRQKTLELDTIKEKLYDVNSKLSITERENCSLLKEVGKLKESLEEKSVLLDRSTGQLDMQTKDINRLKMELEIVEQIQNKFAELEKQNQELISQRGIDLETIETLRNDLVSGTLATNKVRHNLEKLGLNVDQSNENTELNVETVVEKLVRNPETFKTVREIMLNVSREQQQQQQQQHQQQHSNGNTKSDICVLCHRKEIYTVEKNIELSQDNSNMMMMIRNNEPQELSFEHKIKLSLDSGEMTRLTEELENLKALTNTLKTANEHLEEEKACLSVDVATLSSQITSLNTQHVALQLANSQLAADKDVLIKQIDSFKKEHKDILQDQKTLQCLHEQLSAEYESQCKDKEQLKVVIRDLRNELRELRDRIKSYEKEIDEIKIKNACMKASAENHSALRAEHMKLTEDFRSLFSASDRLKCEYKNVQEQYRNVRSEKMKLMQEKAKLIDDLNAKAEQIKDLQIEFAKVTQRCEILTQLNTDYDADRKSLMENVSQLLSQYHELLSHSLEDKQHFHEEEKSYTERVHNLSRQKEKLEEKIMEHYKKSHNTAPKKKPFASSLVRRVKKAGSDIMNIVPTRNRRSWIDESRSNVQTQCTIGSESCGNDSDNSTEEPLSTLSDTHLLQRSLPVRQSLHRLEPPDVTGSSLTLGTAGSRRTVYVNDENQKIPDTSNTTQGGSTISTSGSGSGSIAANSNNNTTTMSTMNSSSTNNSCSTTLGVSVSLNSSSTSASAEPQTPTFNSMQTSASGGGGAPQPLTSTPSLETKNDNPAATFLMYNRINTMIGTNANNAEQQQQQQQQNVAAGSSRDNKLSTSTTGLHKRTEDKANSVWYEYGCV